MPTAAADKELAGIIPGLLFGESTILGGVMIGEWTIMTWMIPGLFFGESAI
jgi:hypothetical protein